MDDSYGFHLATRLGDFSDLRALDDEAIIAKFLTALVARLGMRVLGGPLVRRETASPTRAGCSGLILLCESHAAIHTYPELGQCFLDVFSCRHFSLHAVHDSITSWFGTHAVLETITFDRGLHWPPDVDRAMGRWVEKRDPCRPATAFIDVHAGERTVAQP
jgi:S-adenosylmethionine decarboxylase